MISFMKSFYKNNQVNAWFRRMRGKRDVTCCWFDQKPSNAQLNELDKHPPFTWRSEQSSIDGINGYICYLVDEDGRLYCKDAAVTTHQIQRLPSSLMNILQSKEDIEMFQTHNMEELDVQHVFNYNYINVKVMCLNDIYKFLFLRLINNIPSFHFILDEIVDDVVCNKVRFFIF